MVRLAAAWEAALKQASTGLHCRICAAELGRLDLEWHAQFVCALGPSMSDSRVKHKL